MGRKGQKVLTVDIGTSSIKAGIIDERGVLKSWQRSSYDEAGGDIYSWNTKIWVTALKKALCNLTYLDEIEAVVFSGNGPTIIPVACDGKYTSDSLLWIDDKRTPVPGTKSFFLPKILWFRENLNNKYQDICSFLPLSGFFPYLLTGELTAPIPNKEFASYLWDDESIIKSGIDKDKLPRFILTGELIGRVSAEAGKEYYLKEGLPVFAGANDYLMALLGTGAVFEGAVCDRAGTSEGINYTTSRKIYCESLRSLPHIIDGFENVSGVLASSGIIFEWFRKVSGQQGKSYLALVREISEVIHKEDSLYFFPSLKKGAVWQFSKGAFVGLEARHGILETGSAVVKSIGFSVRDVIQYMESCSLNIEEIRLSGGQAKNPLWNQLKSDMIGKRIIVPEIHDGELLGCACVAFKGLGFYSSLIRAAQDMVHIKEEYNPDKASYDRFTCLFEKYSRMSARIQPLAETL